MIIVQYIYYLVSIRFKYHYEFMGWDGLLLLNILHNNQLKELGDKSNNASLLCQYMYSRGKNF